MSTQLKSRYDIVINGGGIVGFTLLNLILKSPFLSRYKVLLIEQAAKPSNFKQPSRHIERSSGSEWAQVENGSGNSIKFSNRVSSITPHSKATLKKLGAWDQIEHYTKDIHNIKVWNYDYSHKIVFEQNKCKGNLSDKEKSVMFSVAENNRLSLALLDNIYKLDGGNESILWSSSLKNLGLSTNHENLAGITLQDVKTGEESIVDAPLVLGCDGFKSRVRDLAMMDYKEFSLDKAAVVGTVRMGDQDGANNIAYQRFSAEHDTVAALLPLDKEYSSFVISAPSEYAKYLTDCDDDTFCQEFNRLLSHVESPQNIILQGLHDITNRAGDFLRSFQQNLSSIGLTRLEIDSSDRGFEEPPTLESVVSQSRASFPLIFGTTSPRMIATLPGKQAAQIALLGDSTHRVHPLAGQGLNLGIQDATELVKQLEAVSKYGEALFNATDLLMMDKALRRFERRRQSYIVPMMLGILSMPHLFTLLPSRVLSIANKCNPVKSMSVKFANGG